MMIISRFFNKTFFTITLAVFSLLLSSVPAAFAESVLHRGNGAEPETLDIHRAKGVPEGKILRDLFEGLITEAADGSLIAGAAESWKQSDDGLTWTFTLRENGKWSDGQQVKADDFVNAYRRALNPETASDYAFILWPLKNGKAISKGEIKELSQLGVKSLGDLSLEITLENPTPFLKGLLTHPMAYPIPQQALEKHGKKWTRAGNMISNGAYQLSEWLPQQHVKVTKNPHFRDADKVNLDTVFFHPTVDKSSELKRFRAGELDVTEDVPSDQINWVKKNLADNFRNTPYIGTYYLAMNLSKPPFKGNLKLRKALSLAINRKILTDKVTKAGELPGLGWVPPGMTSYTSQTIPELSLKDSERIALAKKLFAESGYDKSKPLEIDYLYNTSDNHKKIAIALSAMWKQTLGVKVKLRNEEWKVYLNTRSQRQFEMIRAGWIGDYNDASNFLDLFRSDVGTLNPSVWSNKEYDSLMQQAASEADSKKRVELMQQAETILLADMPLIPIYYYTTQHLLHSDLKGWIDNVMDVHPSRYLSK